MRLPRITIITPSLNQGSYIEQNILSVINQNYPNVEQWVIDGGSKDNTLEVLHRYEGCINWISEPDKGQSNAVNKGFYRATGEIIGWINSDDKLARGTLYSVADFFKNNPGALAVVGDLDVIDEQSSYVKTLKARQYNHDYLLNEAKGIIQPSMFFKRSLFDKIGYIDEQLTYSMDYDFFLRITQIGLIEYLPKTLAMFRMHNNSKTSAGSYNFIKERIKIRRRYNGSWLSPVGRTAIYIIVTQPLRRIVWLRRLIQNLRKKIQ